MKIIVKRNSELSRENLEVLFYLYSMNLNKTNVENKTHEKTSDKDNWINTIKNNDNLKCFEFYNEKGFVGYILIEFMNDENYISEFQIMGEYQRDGRTFKEMIMLVLPYTNKEKKYSGRIMSNNNHAKAAFKSLGALVDNGKYVIKYDRLVKFLNQELKLDSSMKPLNNQKKESIERL